MNRLCLCAFLLFTVKSAAIGKLADSCQCIGLRLCKIWKHLVHWCLRLYWHILYVDIHFEGALNTFPPQDQVGSYYIIVKDHSVPSNIHHCGTRNRSRTIYTPPTIEIILWIRSYSTRVWKMAEKKAQYPAAQVMSNRGSGP